MKRLTIIPLLAGVLVLGAGRELPAAPGIVPNASPTVSVSSSAQILSAPKSMDSKSMAAPAAKAGFAGATSRAPANAAPATDFVYISDADTDSLQRAIEAYNRQFPKDQIQISNYSGDLSGDVVERLLKYQFLKQVPPNIGNMRIVEGRILRKVSRTEAEQGPQEKGSPADSLGGMLEAATRKTDKQTPTGIGNDQPPGDVRLEQRTLTFRRKNGEFVERMYQVPVLPKPTRVSIPRGKAAPKLNDKLRQEVLPPKLKPQTMQIEPSPASKGTLQSPVASQTQEF